MSVEYKPGASWCDAAHTISGFVRVWSGHGAVHSDRWSTPVPTDHLRYLRAAASPYGDVAAIGVGADDVAYLAHAGGWERWGPAFGQNCVGLYWKDGTWVPVIQRTSESYSIGHAWTAFPPHIRGTSQGFRDVRPNGEIVFGDDAHWTEVLPGVVLHKPNQRGGVIVGQVDGSDRIDGVHSLSQRFSAIPGPAFEPHVAADDLGRFVICARTGLGAAFITVPPFPPLVGTEPPPSPPEPPEPSPMPIPDCLASVERARANFPTPLGDQHAACLIAIVKAIKADHPELDPGLLRKDSGTRILLPDGTAVSQDIICFLPVGEIYDCLSDAEGVASPRWGEASGGPMPERFYRVPNGSTPPPDPEPPPPGLPQLDRIEQMLAQVLLKLNQVFR